MVDSEFQVGNRDGAESVEMETFSWSQKNMKRYGLTHNYKVS